MSEVIAQIETLIASCHDRDDFLTVLFGDRLEQLTAGRALILYGAGALGKEMLYTLEQRGITPAAFCDSNPELVGQQVNSLTVIDTESLLQHYADALILITVTGHERSICRSLQSLGFAKEQILRNQSDTLSRLIAMYAMVGTQALYYDTKNHCPDGILQRLKNWGTELDQAYLALADVHSRDLFVFKLAVLASNLHFELFKQFMLRFSEPCHEFGLLGFEGTPEDYFYFNNDVLSLDDKEIYVDVGAFDGDTVTSFTEACDNEAVHYQKIIAIEPDPACFDALFRNTSEYRDIELKQLGLWSKPGTLQFVSSEAAIHTQAANIVQAKDKAGTITIDVMPLDDILVDQPVTFIKMDPSGDIINEILAGAKETIQRYQPKLALGIYHSLEEFIRVPLMLKSWCTEYQLYLRHNTYHLCDTDLYAKR